MSASRREYAVLVVVLGSLSALSPFAVDAYLPALPAVARDLRAADGAAQATITGVLLGMGLGQLVLGPLSDAIGRRRPALAGVVLHVLTSVACIFAGSIWALIALRFVQGLAGAATAVVAMAVVRDRFAGTQAAVLFSRLLLVVLLAPIVSPIVGGMLLQWTSWEGIFVFLAALGVVIAVLAYLGLPETLPPHRRSGRGLGQVLASYRVLLRDRVMVAMVFVVGFMTGALFVFISASPFVYQDGYGLSELEYALAFAANALCFGVSSQLNPLLLRRWSPVQVLKAVQLMFAIACIWLVVSVALSGSFWAFVVPFSVASLAFGATNPNAQAIALHRHGDRAGAASALVGAGRFGIAGLVAPVVGLFGEISALTSAVALLSLAALSLAAMQIARR
ncbi:MAG: multidrug effflux MFS transporter [Propionibacteriaceae bacterium]|nr:multidrug effflux MFS transporter [Propionibacteriaceae bacterium]